MPSTAVYSPKASWIAQSHLQKLISKLGMKTYEQLLDKSQKETEWFWNEALCDINLKWRKPYSRLLTQGLPWPKWVEGGRISIVENCIDRHLEKRADKPALIFESDSPNQSKVWSFLDLARESSFIAELLEQEGAAPGDRAALLMPMSLEMVAAFFGILRKGLVVVPIFSGYGAEAISTRLNDAKVKFVFIQSKTVRRSKEVNVRENLDVALKESPSVKHVFTLDREEFWKGHQPQKFNQQKPESNAPEAEEPCLFLYTSGTTGKPKACVHTSFGVLATTGKELRYGFDLHQEDRFFWYTDIGWMMGPWELIGALQYGSSLVLYEGVPDFPNADRLWNIIDSHKVTHLGISPTAIRVLKKAGDQFVDPFDLSSLRILGSTGEPWDEESWVWFFEKVGRKRCPIINISGGTEIMGCLLMPNPLSSLKPCTLGGPALGAHVEAWTEDGTPITQGLGHLVCRSPLPSMTKGFLNTPQKYLDTYFEKFGEKTWYHGDWAFIDEDGFWFLKGRSDDTIKIAGKRVGPNEFESALMQNNSIAEAAAVGIPHEIKGECVHCFVVLKTSSENLEPLRKSLLELISRKMGKALQADRLYFVDALPKTRSGKILRGLIRKILLNEKYDESAAENPQALDAINKRR